MSSNTPRAISLEPQSKGGEQNKAVEIPLPPPEMWAQLDNSGAPAPVAEAPVAVAVKEAKVAAIAALDFIGHGHKRSVPLQYPFVYAGAEIRDITVRRLRIGDVDRFVQRARAETFSTFDIYAEMTGLPADVLRGLIDEDGDAVTDACFDFLPRALKPEAEPPAT